MKMNGDLLEKAKNAKSAEELVKLAKENGIELTAEEAKSYFAKLNVKEGELADDELDNVAGGRKCGTIYCDGRPVVTALNSCEYYKKRDGLANDGYCASCHWCEGCLVCWCPERYDN